MIAKAAPEELYRLMACFRYNDNWREWDDDLAAGSVHLIETLEFLLALRKIGSWLCARSGGTR